MRLSLDTFKDNYLISKLNCPTFSLISIFYACNYFTLFLIIFSFLFSLPTNMNMKRQIKMCFFTSMIFILVKIKLDMNINNNEPLKTIWKQKKKKKCWWLLIVRSNAKPKFFKNIYLLCWNFERITQAHYLHYLV
jgi:hypothetical protein